MPSIRPELTDQRFLQFGLRRFSHFLHFSDDLSQYVPCFLYNCFVVNPVLRFVIWYWPRRNWGLVIRNLGLLGTGDLWLLTTVTASIALDFFLVFFMLLPPCLFPQSIQFLLMRALVSESIFFDTPEPSCSSGIDTSFSCSSPFQTPGSYLPHGPMNL